MKLENLSDMELFGRLEARAREVSDGHLSMLRFTTNWRIAFSTPAERSQIDSYSEGKTFREAAIAALESAA